MIQVQQLTKRYASGKGVFALDFHIREGEVFGFLGPNGAGKTTTIRHLLGFMKPDSGRCSINGLRCFEDAASINKNLGYVPGEIAFFDALTGLEFMQLMADLRGLKSNIRRDHLLERFELDATLKIKKMSKGMKQKVGLISALMHDPAVLIFDEPTSGLDPLMQRRFVDLMHEEQARGKTILLSSHMFSEIDRTCQRVAIIRDGRIVDVENLAALKSNLKKTYVAMLANESDMRVVLQSGLEAKKVGERTVEIHVTDDFSPMLEVLAQCHVIGLEVEEQSLEQIFLGYYGKEGAR
jgi:ABC-2 type transport system ATP-binding protein